MSKRSKKNKSIKPFSFDNDDLDYHSIAKSWDLDMSSQSDDSISLPDDQSTKSSKSKKSKPPKIKDTKVIKVMDDIYVDNLANLGKVITVKELFIDSMDLEDINKLPCHILADYGKKYIDLKQEKDIIMNQLNLLGIPNPEKIIYRVQKVPIYCKEKDPNKEYKEPSNIKKIKQNKNTLDDDEQEEFIYGFIFQIICGIVLFCILAFVAYNRFYTNK